MGVLNCHWASPVLAGVSSTGRNSFSNPKKFTTEMLSILLIVAFFRGTTAVACEGDQVLEEGLGGTIASVNFPENYEDNTDCSFTIVPVPGNHVTLQFTDFHVDYSHGGGCMDYITIFPPVDGQTEFCGNLIILSPGKGQLYQFPREEPVTITFHTNEFGSAKGFSAVYYRVDPGKLLFNALSMPVNQNVNF